MAKWIGKLPEIIPVQKKRVDDARVYEQLQEAIADLPEVFRTTIVLREIEGMPHEKLPKLPVFPRTVKSRIARARQRLQLQPQVI